MVDVLDWKLIYILLIIVNTTRMPHLKLYYYCCYNNVFLHII